MLRVPTALVALVAALAATAALAQNLVVNGDFARGGEPPAGWALDAQAASKGSVQVRNGVLELRPNRANTPSQRPLGLGQVIDATGLQGATLELRGRLGAQDGAGAVLGVHALRADGSEIAKVHLRRSAPGEDVASGTLAIPQKASPKRLILIVVAEGTGGVARFSGVTLARSAAPDAQAAAPASPGAGAAFQARVKVDVAKRLRTIPRDLYGVNIEWWRNANGLWDTARDGPDPELVRLTRELRPSLIRFPGGFLGDTYDWRTGVGPRSGRKPQTTMPATGEKAVPLFGTDEVMRFAREVGADLLLTANVGTGTAALAADWVRYVKDARQADPSLPQVRYWELGNELYHKGDASGGALAPRAYADKALAFASAMRAVEPGVALGAIGLENYPAFPFNSHPDWTEVVIRRTSPEIAHYAIHNGYAPVAPDDRAPPLDVYRALWAAPRMVADNLRRTAEAVRRYAAPGRAERIRLSVTEWAPLFHVTPSSAWIDHPKTLGSAVYVADLLRVFIQEPAVGSATFFKLHEPSFLGLIGKRQGAWVPNATYHAFRLYTRHFGSELVEASGASPTYDSVQAGIVPAMKGVPLVESVASVAADGGTLYVMLVNKSADAPADVAVDVTGGAVRAGVAHLLTGASPDANSGAELPNVPGLRWGAQVNVDAQARHFDRGAPSAIAFTSTPLRLAGPAGVVYRLPPHSVASLELALR